MAKAKSEADMAAKPRKKSEILDELAEKNGLTRKQVAGVFDGLSDMIKRDLSKKGPGAFTIPGLLKITVGVRPARKAGKGINPFTKEPMIIKARPAKKVVKARPLKALKDMV